jgi:hypothetical protein
MQHLNLSPDKFFLKESAKRLVARFSILNGIRLSDRRFSHRDFPTIAGKWTHGRGDQAV